MLRRSWPDAGSFQARGLDTLAAALLFLATVLYLGYHWPRDFYGFDEGLYLYEAKRVLDGEVMYRDFFNLITPAWFYFMAGLYGLFGVSLDTARIGMAAIHGFIVALVYVLCRSAGVRRLLAVCSALVHPTVGYPACSIATPHWFATFVTLLLLLAMLRPATSMRRAFLWGLLTSLLILVQQQKGVVMAVAAASVVLLDQLAHRDSLGPALWRAAGFSIGLAAAAGPVMLAFVGAAGFADVFRALVLYPLVNYRRIHDAGSLWNVYLEALRLEGPWFQGIPGLVPLVGVLIYLPLTLPLAALVAAWQWRAKTIATLRLLLVLLVGGAFGFLSVAYNPNPVHLAFIVPVWTVLAAYLFEGLAQVMESKVAAVRVPLAVLAAVLIAGAFWQLRETAEVRRRFFPISTQTAFGRVDFGSEHDVEVYRWFAELLRSARAEEIFSFPANPGLYLVTGTRNPTRYQIVLPAYTDEDQLEEVVAVLEARQVPYVIYSFYWGSQNLEVLHRYLRRNYEPVPPPERLGRLASLKAYRRRSEERALLREFF